MKKRNPYDIILSPDLEPIQREDFSEPKYTDICCENLSISANQQIEFNGCVFERCKFIGDFRKAQFIDCILSRCDLSNTNFASSRFHRVKLSNSKAMGIRFMKAKWQFVTIEDSVLHYGEFADVDFQDILIAKTDLSQSSFFTANLQRISLSQVYLTQTDFSETPLSGLDFSSCDITGIRVSAPCLKGLTVNPIQAEALIGLFGVKVTQ